MELRAQLSGETVEVLCGDELEAAPGELRFNALEVSGELDEFGFVRGEKFFLQRLQFHGLEEANLSLGMLIPIHQGAFGHVEVGGDAGETPALSPQFDEAAFGICRVHSSFQFHFRVTSLRRRPNTRPLRAILAWELVLEAGERRPAETTLPVLVHYPSTTLSVHGRKKLKKVLTGLQWAEARGNETADGLGATAGRHASGARTGLSQRDTPPPASFAPSDWADSVHNLNATDDLTRVIDEADRNGCPRGD